MSLWWLGAVQVFTPPSRLCYFVRCWANHWWRCPPTVAVHLALFDVVTCSLWVSLCSSCCCWSNCWMWFSSLSACVCVSSWSRMYRRCSSSKLFFRHWISSFWMPSCAFCNNIPDNNPVVLFLNFSLSDFFTKEKTKMNERWSKLNRQVKTMLTAYIKRSTINTWKQNRRKSPLPWQHCAPPVQWCWRLFATDGGFWWHVVGV